MIILFFPTEDCPIATGWVCPCEVHRIRTARSRTLANISVGTHRHEHKLTVEIVLPHKHFCFRGISGQTDITGKTIAGTEDVATILALEDNLSLSLVNDAKTG